MTTSPSANEGIAEGRFLPLLRPARRGQSAKPTALAVTPCATASFTNLGERHGLAVPSLRARASAASPPPTLAPVRESSKASRPGSMVRFAELHSKDDVEVVVYRSRGVSDTPAAAEG